MAFRALPQQDRLRSLFDYDPITGSLLNKRLNKPAGFVLGGGNSTKKHWAVKVDGYVYTMQRVIWMWVYGEDPQELMVDHIDRDSLNNKLDNLRLVTRAQNRENSKLNKNNSSGYRYVYRMGKKWQAKIKIDGKIRSIGVFLTPEEAYQAAITRLGSL